MQRAAMHFKSWIENIIRQHPDLHSRDTLCTATISHSHPFNAHLRWKRTPLRFRSPSDSRNSVLAWEGMAHWLRDGSCSMARCTTSSTAQ